MIKEISCNNDDDTFSAYCKYLSQLCRGMKTDVIIYKKSAEGIGKSNETDFLVNHVLGKDICFLSSSAPLTTDFNKCYMGKLLIYFEELPTFGPREWESASSKLKTLTTEKTAFFMGKNKDGFQAENISNCMINTNVESIKNSGGRRYIILNLNDSRKGDNKYFESIRKDCFNNIVGEAFYSYMKNIIDVKGFYAQKDFPDTENKRLAIASQLDPIEKFIKCNYILKERELTKTKTSDFYTEYCNYMRCHDMKPLTNTLFYSKLKSLCKIEKIKTNGTYYFKESYETLKALSDKNKWVCEYDEIETDDDETDNELESPLDAGLKSPYIDYKKLYEEAQKQIEILKLKIQI